MANCSEMKVGEIYTCEDCGFELKVLKECICGPDCNCESFSCCGKPLTLKQA